MSFPYAPCLNGCAHSQILFMEFSCFSALAARMSGLGNKLKHVGPEDFDSSDSQGKTTMGSSSSAPKESSEAKMRKEMEEFWIKIVGFCLFTCETNMVYTSLRAFAAMT